MPPADSTDLLVVSCASVQCLHGSPKIQTDSSITQTLLTTFDGATFGELRNLATRVIAGGSWRIRPQSAGGKCLTAAPDNWGDPYDPAGVCGDHFPLVFSTADLRVSGGRGQGVLIVDGDLWITGGFQYFGLVIIRGALVSTGTGGIRGAVIAANHASRQNSVLGETELQYSSCVLRRSLAGTGRGVLLRERSWLQAY